MLILRFFSAASNHQHFEWIWLGRASKIAQIASHISGRAKAQTNSILLRSGAGSIKKKFLHKEMVTPAPQKSSGINNNFLLYPFQLILLACFTWSWVNAEITHQLPRRKSYGHNPHYGPYGPTPKPYTPYPSPTVLDR